MGIYLGYVAHPWGMYPHTWGICTDVPNAWGNLPWVCGSCIGNVFWVCG